MAYDEDLAQHIRELVSHEPGIEEKRMFGGLAFLIAGNIWLRVAPEGVRTKAQLERWVNRGVRYARSLPAKR